MSDPESPGQAKERAEMRERKKEKKRRKAEKRLSETLARDKIASSSSSRLVQETEEKERARRKKERKEAKKLKKHKESSAAGQRAVSDAPMSNKETTVLMPARSKSMGIEERQTKKNRKRKERSERAAQQEEAASGSQVIASEVAYSTEPFYPIMPPSPKDGDQPWPKKKKARVDTPAQDPTARNIMELNEEITSSAVMAEKTSEKRKKRKEKEREKERFSEREEAIEVVKPTSTSEVVNDTMGDETTSEKEIESQQTKKRKSKSKRGVEKELVPSNGAANGETEDLEAMQPSTSVDSGEAVASSKVKKAAQKPRKSKIQRQIDNIIAKASRSGNGERSASRDGNANSTSRESGAASLSTREGTLEDARGLTHKEMLVDRLYHSNQLKWLQEEFDLKVKTGRFSKWERDRIDDAISQFKKEQSLSDEDFFVWLFNTKQEIEEKQLYTQFWKSITASLEDRPNRAVRIAVRRSLQPDASQGAWSNIEMSKLTNAVQANGKNWAAVARAVGSRSAEDCRLRWRDFAPALQETKKKGRFTGEDKHNLIAAVRSVCQESNLDPMSPSSNIPWKKVADKIGGERSPAHCLTKWQALLKKIDGSEEGSSKWTLEDSQTFVSRLWKEKHALERDDFTEVKLASLRSADWLMEPARLLEKWKGLVRQYVSPSANYKIDFRSNLQTIHKALATAAETSAIETTHKRRRSSQVKEDLIESYEEV